MSMGLVRETEKLVRSGVSAVRLLGHIPFDGLARLCSPLTRLARIAFVLSHYLFVVVDDSYF